MTTGDPRAKHLTGRPADASLLCSVNIDDIDEEGPLNSGLLPDQDDIVFGSVETISSEERLNN